jgi:chromosome transmission fidelity protein 18
MVKRPRLDVVKKLNFEPDMEELLYPDSPPGDITPPPSPEVFPEMLDAGCVA